MIPLSSVHPEDIGYDPYLGEPRDAVNRSVALAAQTHESTTETISDLAADAIAALTGTRWSITDAPAHVPARPGLYAIFGDERAHRGLGLLEDAGARSAPDLPLYVGKAEASFVERDLKDYFAAALGSTARTGGSTVRRSFAALLGNQLELHAVPRNLASPGSC